MPCWAVSSRTPHVPFLQITWLGGLVEDTTRPVLTDYLVSLRTPHVPFSQIAWLGGFVEDNTRPVLADYLVSLRTPHVPFSQIAWLGGLVEDTTRPVLTDYLVSLRAPHVPFLQITWLGDLVEDTTRPVLADYLAGRSRSGHHTSRSRRLPGWAVSLRIPHVTFSQTCHRPLLQIVVSPSADVAVVLFTTDSSQKGEKAAHSTSTTATCVARQPTITGSVCTPISDRSGWPPHGYSAVDHVASTRL